MKIFVFWDSIAQWHWDEITGWWVNMLKIHLLQQNRKIETINAGISWYEVSDILGMFEKTIDNYTKKSIDETKIILAVGINDSVIFENNDQVVSIEKFINNYQKLLKLSKNITDNITVIWLTNVDERISNPASFSSTWKCYQNDRILGFDMELEKLCNRENINYIKLFWLLDTKTDLDDWVHPNQSGHKIIFKKIKSNLLNTKN